MIAARLLQLLPPETAHRLAVMALGLLPQGAPARRKNLAVTVAGLRFPNPIGLAAGFDKNAEAMGGAFGMGFGHVEVGTITPRPQKGNAPPRVFRLMEDNAVINRYGFNNDGMEAVARRLEKYRARKNRGGILGVNIGANKDSKNPAADYHEAALCLAPFADYVTVNISSPNTPGLRDLQAPMRLAEIIAATFEGMKKPRPLFVKLSPDLDKKSLSKTVEKAVECGCHGLIIANTTTHRPDWLKSRHRHETGGLSGAPLFTPSTRMLAYCRGIVPRGFPLIATGGVHDAASAMTKLRAGASLVQIYTALALGRVQSIRRMLADMEKMPEKGA